VSPGNGSAIHPQPRRGGSKWLTGPLAWVEAALAILKDALALDGAGAKTAAGYGRMDVSPLTSSSSPTAWQSRLAAITMSNAAQDVPRLLSDLKGEARRLAAQALVKSLGRPLRDAKRKDKPWVQDLLKAAE